MFRYWSIKEVELLKSDMTDEEIAQKTGRTVKAVRSKRMEIKNGHFADPVDEENYIYNPYKNLTQQEKENRIYKLAEKLEVKLAR